jgi:formiminotetrahydrofolate cyclodeaminase
LDSASEFEYRGLSLDEFLSRVSMPEPAPAGGSVAAIGAALAASLCVKAARLSARQMAEATELATRAGGLRDRAASLSEADALVYADVVAARRRAAGPHDPGVATALSVAADIPLETASLAREVADVAVRLAEHGNPGLVGDAVTAALIAAAAARGAAALVRLNLAEQPDDPRHSRAAELVAATDALRARALELA